MMKSFLMEIFLLDKEITNLTRKKNSFAVLFSWSDSRFEND